MQEQDFLEYQLNYDFQYHMDIEATGNKFDQSRANYVLASLHPTSIL